MQYAFGKTVALTHDEAVARVTEALGKEGFGVLTEIDVAANPQAVPELLKLTKGRRIIFW